MPVIVVGSTSYILPITQSSHQTGFSAPREISNDIWRGPEAVCWKGSNRCVLSVSREDVLLPLSRRRVADEPPFLFVEIRLPGSTYI